MAVFPIANPIFQPAIRQIAAITSSGSFEDALTLSVTTTQNHLYKDGLVVRLSVPIEYGAYQLDQLEGEMIVTGATVFFMVIRNFGALKFDPFVIPGSPKQPALTIPIAEDVLLLNSAVVNVLP